MGREQLGHSQAGWPQRLGAQVGTQVVIRQRSPSSKRALRAGLSKEWVIAALRHSLSKPNYG